MSKLILIIFTYFIFSYYCICQNLNNPKIKKIHDFEEFKFIDVTTECKKFEDDICKNALIKFNFSISFPEITEEVSIILNFNQRNCLIKKQNISKFLNILKQNKAIENNIFHFEINVITERVNNGGSYKTIIKSNGIESTIEGNNAFNEIDEIIVDYIKIQSGDYYEIKQYKYKNKCVYVNEN